jgi:DNA-binding MarR family transcriptional regulator
MRSVFRALKAAGDFRRRHMPFVATLEDQDLIREIGFAQAMARPLTLKQLFTHGIASVATVQRRLARLKRLGVVQQTRVTHDRRIRRLTLSPEATRLFARWGRELRKA